MGIPHYFHTITQTYKGILHFTKPVTCKHYFFDYNGAIHHGAQTVLKKHEENPLEEDAFEPEILNELWEYTQKCVDVASPSNTIGIYVDGVAPIAKINQQRKRRYLTVFRNRILKTRAPWDTNAISPGTAFMTRMYAFIRNKIRENPRTAKYTFSGANEVGEGEHKIFAHIGSLPRDETVFIHGLDADLIMLSLISHRPNIYLMREPSWPYTNASTDDGFLYLDIHTLRISILQHLEHEFQWTISEEAFKDPYGKDAMEIIETYVVLCFILGNDFLPHGPTLSLKSKGYERLLRAAKSAMELWPSGCVILDEKRVFLPFISHVLQTVAKDENDYLWKANEDYLKRKPSVHADKADAYPLQPEHKHPLASVIYHSGHPTKWRAHYYKHLFFTRMHDTRIIAQACKEYITGICWTYAYYKKLSKPSDWYYPYGYPPTLLDIANYLQGTMHEWDETQMDWKRKYKQPKYLEPAVQLMCILPKESLHLIPMKYQKMIEEHKYGLMFMFPVEYPIQTYLHTHLWECAPILPLMDIPWILKCTNTELC